MKEERAQISIEALLLIGGAIVVAVSAGLYLKGMAAGIAGQASERTSQAVGTA